MYYNLTTEQKYILTLSDTMLKEGYTVDEVIEFLQCEDMDQVECILGTLTLTESVDVDHPDLELVLERVRALTSIGSWLARQAGKLKGAFGRGPSQVTRLQQTGTGAVKTSKVTNPDKGLFYGIRKKLGLTKKSKNITGDVPKTSSKLKTAAKIAAGAGAAVLVGTGIENAMKDGKGDPNIKDDPDHTPSSNSDSSNSSTGSGGRTRAYGWWKKSHASSPYVSNIKNYNNIRRTPDPDK